MRGDQEHVLDHFRGILGLASMAILVIVFILMCWSSWQNHRTRHNPDDNFHGSIVIELSWVAAPFIIVWALVWPTARNLWFN